MSKSSPVSTLTFEDLSDYQQMVVEDTRCELEDAYKIVQIMRDEVFHSTLDWQSRAEFRRGARKAFKLYQEDRAYYDEWFAQLRRNFEEGKAREEAEDKAKAQDEAEQTIA